MNGDDLEVLLLFVSLGLVLALSAFFWFARKIRDGWLLRTLYVVRLFYAAFFAYGVVWIFEVLYGGAPVNHILLVALPFGVLCPLLSTPWGFIAMRLGKNKPHKDSALLETT